MVSLGSFGFFFGVTRCHCRLVVLFKVVKILLAFFFSCEPLLGALLCKAMPAVLQTRTRAQVNKCYLLTTILIAYSR